MQLKYVKSVSLGSQILKSETAIPICQSERVFTRFGFRHVDRGAVPEPIRSSAEYRELCPASAAVMMREIERRREGR